MGTGGVEREGSVELNVLEVASKAAVAVRFLLLRAVVDVTVEI